jgi:hypothetical protein
VRKDWLGNEYVEHTDAAGARTGTSHVREGWLGGSYTETEGNAPSVKGRSRGSDGTSDSKPSDGNGTVAVGFGAAIAALIALLLG